MTYKLPFGSGQKYVQHGILNQAFGGWLVSTIFQLHSGIPFTPVMGTANLSGSLQSEAHGSRTGVAVGRRIVRRSRNGITFAAFSQPSPYTFGNSGRNILFGPGWKDVDLSLEKTFKISAFDKNSGTGDQRRCVRTHSIRQTSECRMLIIGTSAAGTITTANTSRNIQLGAHWKF